MEPYGRASLGRAKMTLVLLHEPGTQCPRDTQAWLNCRSVSRHIHVRKGHEPDYHRLSRIISGRATGLVLAGGGARGFAHIGVLAALSEMGIQIDMVGGTSIGSIMGAYVSLDIIGESLIDAARHVFLNAPKGNISGDYNILPIMSVIKGQRAWKATLKAIEEHAGHNIDMEDTWKTTFAIASNYSTQREQVLSRGNLARNIMASFSIPGMMPPVLIDKHLMFDGGSFNNFPVDVMRRMGAGKIIGIDLMSDFVREYDLDSVPTPATLFWDRLRPKSKRRFNLPSLPSTLLTASVVTSMSRQKDMREHVDLLFQPNIRGITMLDWKKYDLVVERTKADALEKLRAMPPEALAPFKD